MAFKLCGGRVSSVVGSAVGLFAGWWQVWQFIIINNIRLMSEQKDGCICSSIECAYNLDEASEKLRTSPNSENQWPGGLAKNGQSSSENGNETGSKDASGLSLDKDTFKEHIMVVRAELPEFQSFLQRNKIEAQKSPLPQIRPNLHEKNSSSQSGGDGSNSNENSRGEEKVIELQKSFPPALRRFMAVLRKQAQSSSGYPLAVMGSIIWERYCGLREKVFEVYELLNYSQQVLDSLELECEERLLGKLMSAEDKDYLTNFLQIFSATLLLVSNQYFQNPYCEQTAKREERDDESDPSGKTEGKEVMRSRKIVHRDSTEAVTP